MSRVVGSSRCQEFKPQSLTRVVDILSYILHSGSWFCLFIIYILLSIWPRVSGSWMLTAANIRQNLKQIMMTVSTQIATLESWWKQSQVQFCKKDKAMFQNVFQTISGSAVVAWHVSSLQNVVGSI